MIFSMIFSKIWLCLPPSHLGNSSKLDYSRFVVGSRAKPDPS